MDQDRFDALTRALGSGRSRRGVLKGLAGAALGALAGVAGLEAAGANPPPKFCKYQGSNCKGNADCCTLNCCNRTCCGDGQVCASGQCVFATTTTPAPTTTTTPKPTTTTTTTPAPNLCAGVTCNALDQCHAAGTCNPATGQCSNPALADFTPCDDGDACTTNDQCYSGICKGTPVDTTSDPNNCGGCGKVCQGGDACNKPICSGGMCTTAPTMDCTSTKDCMFGYCDPGTGACAYKITPGAPCNGGTCDANGVCQMICVNAFEACPASCTAGSSCAACCGTGGTNGFCLDGAICNSGGPSPCC